MRHFSYPLAANEHVNLSKGNENPVRIFFFKVMATPTTLLINDVAVTRAGRNDGNTG